MIPLGKPGAPTFEGGRWTGTKGGFALGGTPGVICGGGRACCAFELGKFCWAEAASRGARGVCGCVEFETGRCCDCCAFGGGGCAYIFEGLRSCEAIAS